MKVQKKIIILVSIVIIFIISIIYFVILPTIKDIKAINHAVDLERADLEIKYQRGQLLNKVLDDFEKIKAGEEKFKSVFINAGEELEFITSLEKIAEKYNIIQDLRLTDPIEDKKSSHKTSQLSVVANGEFAKIIEYLEEINELNYYYNVDSVTMNSNPSENNNVELKMGGSIFIIDLDQN